MNKHKLGNFEIKKTDAYSPNCDECPNKSNCNSVHVCIDFTREYAYHLQEELKKSQIANSRLTLRLADAYNENEKLKDENQKLNKLIATIEP